MSKTAKTKTTTVTSTAKETKKKVKEKGSKPLLSALKDLFIFPKYDYDKQTITIFAGDPGIKNFGYVIFEASNYIDIDIDDRCLDTEELRNELYTKLEALMTSISIRRVGFLKNCIADLRFDNLIPYLDYFHRSNKELYDINIDYLVLERYQARDLKGPRNEIINISIASLIAKLSAKPYNVRNARLLIPAQWKRYYTLDKTNNVKGLDLVYDTWKKDKELRKTYQLTDHQTDALLLGIYFLLDLLLGPKKDIPIIKEWLVNYCIKNAANIFRQYFHTLA